MKEINRLLLAAGGILLLLLAACGNSSPAAEEASPAEALTDEIEYAEYAGYQFSGTDPWEGTLTITVRSILDGKMEWIFTDSFEDHTLYQVQKDTVLQNGKADFDIRGRDVENDDVSFAYQGTLELKDGDIVVAFDSGAVTGESPEGGASYHIAEALADSGLSNQAVLSRTVNGPYVSYTVQEGDSIHSIAEEHGISTKDLCILNQIVIIETAKAHGLEFDDVTEYAGYLYPGEELLVPNQR